MILRWWRHDGFLCSHLTGIFPPWNINDWAPECVCIKTLNITQYSKAELPNSRYKTGFFFYRHASSNPGVIWGDHLIAFDMTEHTHLSITKFKQNLLLITILSAGPVCQSQNPTDNSPQTNHSPCTNGITNLSCFTIL